MNQRTSIFSLLALLAACGTTRTTSPTTSTTTRTPERTLATRPLTEVWSTELGVDLAMGAPRPTFTTSATQLVELRGLGVATWDLASGAHREQHLGHPPLWAAATEAGLIVLASEARTRDPLGSPGPLSLFERHGDREVWRVRIDSHTAIDFDREHVYVALADRVEAFARLDGRRVWSAPGQVDEVLAFGGTRVATIASGELAILDAGTGGALATASDLDSRFRPCAAAARALACLTTGGGVAGWDATGRRMRLGAFAKADTAAQIATRGDTVAVWNERELAVFDLGLAREQWRLPIETLAGPHSRTATAITEDAVISVGARKTVVYDRRDGHRSSSLDLASHGSVLATDDGVVLIDTPNQPTIQIRVYATRGTTDAARRPNG